MKKTGKPGKIRIWGTDPAAIRCRSPGEGCPEGFLYRSSLHPSRHPAGPCSLMQGYALLSAFPMLMKTQPWILPRRSSGLVRDRYLRRSVCRYSLMPKLSPSRRSIRISMLLCSVQRAISNTAGRLDWTRQEAPTAVPRLSAYPGNPEKLSGCASRARCFCSPVRRGSSHYRFRLPF